MKRQSPFKAHLKRPLLLVCALLLALSQTVQGAVPKGAAAGYPSDPPRIIVRPASGASAGAVGALHRSLKARVIRELPALGLQVVQGPAAHSAQTLADAYRSSGIVAFAEADDLVSPTATPSDPQFPGQWHHAKVESPAAWDRTAGSALLIGLCDTGADGAHPDLAPNLRGDLGYNAVDGTSNWTDEVGHGTATAGVLAAAGNNAVGVAGVMWQAGIIPVRISNLPGGGAYVSDAAACIQYAADKGSQVINLSYRMAGYAAIDTAARYARDLGAVTTVAAGNDGFDPGWPNYSSFLAISATDSTDLRATWSNHGLFVDLAAPGTSVLTTGLGGGYASYDGTSLAAPIAAGVLGLIRSANPSLTADEAEKVILSTADDLGAAGVDSTYGAGRVNARKAVDAALIPVSGTVRINDGATYSTSPDVALTLSASDAAGLMVTDMQFALDGSTWGLWEPFGASKLLTLVPGDGPETVYARFRDAAGYVSAPSSATIVLDTEPGIVTGSTPSDRADVSTLSGLVLTLSDVTSGPESAATMITATKDGAAFTGFSRDNSVAGRVTLDFNQPSDGKYLFSVVPVDRAGNVATTPTLITITDWSIALSAPSNLAARLSGHDVLLSWTDNSVGESSFVVERATKLKSGAGAYAVVGMVSSADLQGTGRSVQFKNASVPSGTYLYRVKAVNPVAVSSYSAAIQVRVR